MPTSNWSAFFDKVLPYMKGCPVALAQDKIAEAASEFCTETFVWKVDHDAINVVAGTSSYSFAPPSNTKVFRIDRAWHNRKEIYPKNEEELNQLYAEWPTETGTPLYFLQQGLEAVRLVPYPNASLTGGLKLLVSLVPSAAAPGLDTTLWERYTDEIAAGALQKLFEMPGKPWTSGDHATYYAGKFEAAKGRVRYAATRGHTRARVRHSNPQRRFM